MDALYFAKHIRICELKAVEEGKISEADLMLRAGKDAFNTFRTLYKDVESIAVFCGGGNNAGDGYVFAKLAHLEGLTVTLYQGKSVEELPPTAQLAAKDAVAAGISCFCLDEALDPEVELIVDALLGIGLQGEVRDPIAHAIDVINESGLPVISLDVPSGLDADTGKTLGACVQASMTITFIAPKVGFYTLDGPDHCGEIVCHNLQIDNYLSSITPAAALINKSLLEILPTRKKNSYKSMFGHVLIIGGGVGMPGAVSLAAQACLRVGAGLVSVATWPGHELSMLPLAPEAMVHAIHNVDELLPLLEKATVCIIGPGLGESSWAKGLFSATLAAQLPLVIDASALRMLGKNPQHDDDWILTPHPGEAASLLSCSSAEIQMNRCKSAQLIQQQYGGCVVLKGAGTIIHTADQNTFVCAAGNPGMASAGMGDVLSGIIGGLLAQKVSLPNAAKLGVWLHAQAGDMAASCHGERGLLASDLMPYLHRLINAV